jgi:hypothetical protein
MQRFETRERVAEGVGWVDWGRRRREYGKFLLREQRLVSDLQLSLFC